jgi:hypothetical protein
LGANITDVWYWVMTKLAPIVPISRRKKRDRAQRQQRRVRTARAELVAQRSDQQARQHGDADGGDIDVGDLSLRQRELALDDRHQRRHRKPGEEAREEREPAQMKRPHGGRGEREEADLRLLRGFGVHR